MKRFCLLLVLATIPIHIICQQHEVFAIQNKTSQRISIDSTIKDHTHLEPFTSEKTICGLAFSGEITLHSDSSLVRIVLMDQNYNEYLIYEAYPILSGSRQFSVEEAGEETALLDNITPTGVSIELVDASVDLKEIFISEEEPDQAISKGALLLQQSKNKIDRINQNIKDLGQFWVAGETSISRLSYQEQKSMFGGRVPNFQGFEYYVGGVFVLLGTSSKNLSQQESQFPREFSWRDRNGEDWVTPVKNQGGCGSCVPFGITAATELLVNLYFNQHLDYDLSEQNIVSCLSGSCTDGWTVIGALDFIKKSGIVWEDCFPYTSSDLECSSICKDPSERINIASWDSYINEEHKKREIIKGATVGQIVSWDHVAQIIGYKVIEAGDHLFVGGYDTTSYISIDQDNPLIGETAWLCKNSWGESWGNNGYGYIVGDEQGIILTSLHGPVTSLIFSEIDVICTNNDGDSYYDWGVGPKPSHCPESPDEADYDDENPFIGPMDEYGNLLSGTSPPEAKDTIIWYGQAIPDLYASGSNIQWYSDRELLNLVHTENLFPTGHTEPEKYTYYVTQTLSGIESEANDVSLSIVELAPPFGHDTIINEGEPAVLTVEGEQDAVFKWYKDPILTILLARGESYETEKKNIGVYTFYVTQTIGLIESAPDSILLTIANFIPIPDQNFLNALIKEGVDTDGNHVISIEEAEMLTSLGVEYKNISDLTGIEAFVNLEELACGYNKLASLDVSNNTALRALVCSYNELTSLDLSFNEALDVLVCEENQLSSLHVSGCMALSKLDCSDNQITSLDVSNITTLSNLDCSTNQLSSLDVSGCTALSNLICWDNQLTSLDVSGCTSLTALSCALNQLSSLDVSTCISLKNLACYFNELKSLDVSACTALESLRCSHNRLTSLDVSNDTALQHLNCSENQLSCLDVSNNIALYWLGCDNNQLSSLDVSNNPLIGSDNYWGYLSLRFMPSLREVCVWTLPFPPWRVEVDITGSPNVEFIDCSVDIEESTHPRLRIYPNPAHSELIIEKNYPEHSSIEITSLNGQLLQCSQMEGTIHHIDLSSFQKGVYFITLRSKDFVSTRKIIKL